MSAEAVVDERPEDAAPEEGDLLRYDFKSPLKAGLPRQGEVLELMGEFAAEFEAWLGSRFRESVRVSINGIELAPFRIVRERLPKPCYTYLYTVNEAADRVALLTLSPDFFFSGIERLMGGGGTPALIQRAASELEIRAMGLVITRLLADFTRTWREHVPLSFGPLAFESAPELMSIATREDRYFGVQLTVRGEAWEGQADVWLPTQAMDEYLAASPDEVVQPRVDPAIQQDHDNVRRTLMGAHVEVSARLPAFGVSLGTLARLTEGMVLPTRLSTDAPIELWIGGQRRFLGSPGRSGKSLAVRVTGPAPAGGGGKNPQT
ncbi:MAG: FliM/FliN family flagellar motor switch protein [Gemmatimonadota bacterium]|nr:FliM/FliN family flagellar motor switch protein [Gemmatimonadota bacterium]